MHSNPTEPSLLLMVRTAFIAKGTSLHAWCASAGVDRSYAAKAISGQATFPAAIKLRRKVLAAAGIEVATPRKRKHA